MVEEKISSVIYRKVSKIIIYDIDYFNNNSNEGYTDYTRIQNKVSKVIDDIETELGISDWSGERVLDAGCAFGYFTNELNSRGANVSGIDSSSYAISQAQALFPSLDFREESIIDTSFNPNTFDVILAIGLLETLADDTAITDALDEMIKIDKGGVKLYFLGSEESDFYKAKNPTEWQEIIATNYDTKTVVATLVKDHPLLYDVRITVV